MKNTRHVWKIVITMVLGSMIFLACGTPDTATPPRLQLHRLPHLPFQPAPDPTRKVFEISSV